MRLETFSLKKLWLEFSGRGFVFTKMVLQTRLWPKPCQIQNPMVGALYQIQQTKHQQN